MKPFLGDDFLLHTETARLLYHDYAAHQPIVDYHCHLPPEEIAQDRQFKNMAQIWLEGDHYKWRAMRSAGINENYITGNASEKEKYDAWAKTVPQCLGNPLYIWTHLELQRPFGKHGILFGPDTSENIWQECNALLQTPEFSARGIMQKMNVRMVGTTDDPCDSLEHHKAISDSDFTIDVVPSFRPDRAFKIDAEGFANYVQKLADTSDIHITHFHHFIEALNARLDYFAQHGCKLADHGIEHIRYAGIPPENILDDILEKGINEKPLSENEIAQFSTAVQVWLGKQYARRGWVMQYHIGPIRNNNSRMLKIAGANAGFDSIGDRPIAEPLAKLLNAMDYNNELPKTILYCINPRDNEVLGTMIGNFQDGSIAGKIQFGSAWWFNDQKDGMIRQITQLSQLGLLSQFVGMLTDSRSFLSYTRHEYFRRILCELLGTWVENGELPRDEKLLGSLVENVCAKNALRYFDLSV